MSTTYYPAMAYRMVSLEPALRPPTGLGDLPDTAWFSTGHPQGGFTPIRGLALPTVASSLTWFKALQTQINRILAKGRYAVIGVDGRIGPGTAKGLLTASRWARAQGFAAPTSISSYVNANTPIPVDTIAHYADVVGAALQAHADRMQMPVVAGANAHPSQPTASGGVANPSANVMISDAKVGILASLGIPTPLAIAAGVVGVLAVRKYMGKGGKGRGRVRARRRRR